MFAFGCTVNVSQNENAAGGAGKRAENNSASSAKNYAEPAKSPENKERVNPRAESSVAAKDKTACLSAKMTGKKLIESQTFAFDSEPFRGACFVTFADTKEMLNDKDVPRGSTFHIFRDGKQIFQFPDAFEGMSGCWVEAVSFADLNDDGLTDVVVAGSCLAAKNSYPMNAIYVNSGNGFTTNPDANAALDNFDKIKDIENFVRKNKNKFFQ